MGVSHYRPSSPPHWAVPKPVLVGDASEAKKLITSVWFPASQQRQMCLQECLTPEVPQLGIKPFTVDRNLNSAPLMWPADCFKNLTSIWRSNNQKCRVSKHVISIRIHITTTVIVTLMDSLPTRSNKSSKTNELHWYKAQLSWQLTPSPYCTSCSPPASPLLVSPSFSSLFHRYRNLFVLSDVHWSLWFRDLEIWGTVIWLAVTAGRCEEQTMTP